MQGEGAAFFQYAQGLLHEHELILLRAYLMKDEVADDGVEMVVGEVELRRISVPERAAVCDALCRRVAFALLFAVVPHCRPVVDALYLRERELFCDGDGERARAAADVERRAAAVPRQLIEQIAVNAPHEPAALEGKDPAAVVHIDDDKSCSAGEDREDIEGRFRTEKERAAEREHIEYSGNRAERFHHRHRNPVAVVWFHKCSSLFLRDAVTASTSLFTSARRSLRVGENAASLTP